MQAMMLRPLLRTRSYTRSATSAARSVDRQYMGFLWLPAVVASSSLIYFFVQRSRSRPVGSSSVGESSPKDHSPDVTAATEDLSTEARRRELPDINSISNLNMFEELARRTLGPESKGWKYSTLLLRSTSRSDDDGSHLICRRRSQ
jgi:hypothetical protein